MEISFKLISSGILLIRENPIRSIGRMRIWYTSKPYEYTEKSHINHVVVDCTWDASEANRTG